MEKHDQPQFSALGYFILGFIISMIVNMVRNQAALPLEDQTLFAAAFFGTGFTLINALIFWWTSAHMPLFLSRFLCLFVGAMVAMLVYDTATGFTLTFTLLRFVVELVLSLLAYQFFVKRFKQKQNAS